MHALTIEDLICSCIMEFIKRVEKEIYTRLPNAPMLNHRLNMKNDCRRKGFEHRGMSHNNLWIPLFVV